jgi:predicted ATPase/DNA-binding winged helix-turn-helix (wHTH) protein/class 3 adenylate cyclase
MLYTFGDHYTLDPVCYELRQHGRLVRLEPRVFDLLAYLVQAPDRTVTKQELVEHLWPQQFVADESLTYCVARARKVLGDTGQTQRYIQTVHRRGYRFIAPVEERPAAPPAQAPAVTLRPALATPPQDDTRRRLDPALLSGEDCVASSGAGEVFPAPRASLVPRPAPAAMVPVVPGGERKLVTLLGCTLAPAAALQAHEGLDALHRQMRTLYTLAQQEIHRYGGTIHHVAGTRLLAIFGAPVAHEDHARRAVLAAWGLHQRLAASRSEDPAEEPLAVCLGLHTGLVVMGGIGDTQGAAAVVGDLPLAVEALQERAAPGMLLCSEATARLVRQHVRLEEVASAPVPGQPTPMRIYQVMGLRTLDVSGTQGALQARSPFVGRVHELATLHAVLAQVVGGRGQAVGIVGEPGIGKSRLLMEWRQQLHGVTYLEGRCLSYGSATPYLPVLDLLQAHCGITPADNADAITSKVCRSLRAVGLAPDTEAPSLLHLLGGAAGTAQVAGSSPDTLKAHIFATLRQLWLTSSQQHPLILAVEDLHWSDPTSEEFFALLVEGLPGAALLVLGTYRPGYRPAWLEKSYATQLTVSPLSAQDSVQIVQAVLQQATVPPPLAEALLARTQGNPFFLEELAQTLVEQDAGHADEPVAPPTVIPAALQLPPTVQAVLAARIDRLAPEDKHLLQTAAVIGKDVPVPLLQAIAEVPEATLHQGLAHLQAAEFLYETPRFPEHAYTFKHALTHEVAYGSLLLEQRRVLHARVVEALEALAPDRMAEQVERLAYHALRGEVWNKALGYCRQAGEKAMARSAYREAVGYFEQALGILQHLPEQRDTREQAIDLRLVLRDALLPSGDYGRILAYLREAESLVAALDDPHRLGRISLSLSHHFFIIMGAHDQAIATSQRALALATASRDGVLHAQANNYLGLSYHTQGDYRRAIDCLGQTVAFFEGARRRERSGGPFLPAVTCRAWLAMCHAELGMFAAGRALGDEGLRIAEAVTQPASLMTASRGIGQLSLRQGDLLRALPMLERAVGLCQEAGLPLYFPSMAAVLGAAYTLAGRVADAVPLLTQALEQTIATEMTGRQTYCSLTLGEAQLLAGRLEEAYALADRALELAHAHKERGHQAYALCLLGDIAARRESPEAEQAAAHYQQALALAKGLGMRPLQAHCHRGLGTLYATTGQGEQARTELSTAIALYRTMDMTFWLPQTEAALAQVGRAEEPEGGLPGGIAPRASVGADAGHRWGAGEPLAL